MQNDFYRELADAARSGTPAWLATVITSTGSTPARVGMKMIVGEEGLVAGTIGGGALEKSVLEKILKERPSASAKWAFDLGAGSGAEHKTPMVCGGVEEILVEALSSGVPLVIFGGGHCGVALSRLASWTGFAVTVYDDREEWASREKHPSAVRTLCGPYDGITPHISVTADMYGVIMTHGHQHDADVLRQAIGLPWRYLGMIGSARKVGVVLDGLRSEGVDENLLKRVFTPVGFPIGSHTPEEIAVSIVAQMVAVRNGVLHSSNASN
jgi:xanthine dehydrogenase accessory factor